MKKIAALLCALMMVATLAACGAEDKTLTIPGDLIALGGVPVEDLKKDPTVKDFKENEDGSISVTVSEKNHKDIMVEMKKTLDDTIAQITAMPNMTHVKTITTAEDYTSATIEVDKDAYEALPQDMAGLAIGMATSVVNYFNAGDGKLDVIIKDAATGDEIDRISFPEAMDDLL